MAKWDDLDWFRSSNWNDEIAVAFEARLKRARTWNRAQYLRIQGSHLIEQDALNLRRSGRALLTRVIEEFADSDQSSDQREAFTATEQLAKSLLADGEVMSAEHTYREALVRGATTSVPRPSLTTELALAELLLLRGDRSSHEEANALLDVAEDQVERAPFFRDLVMRYYVARARVSHLLGDPARAAEVARQALAVADETEPALPRHPTVGRPSATQQLRAELLALAEG